MKTEPTEALRKNERLFELTDSDIKQIEMLQRLKEELAVAAFKKGQSNPKIKQLEWDFYGLYYDVKTAVGHYMILQGDEQYLENYGICTLTHNGSFIADFNSIEEAKDAAQAEFEKLVKEYSL